MYSVLASADKNIEANKITPKMQDVVVVRLPRMAGNYLHVDVWIAKFILFYPDPMVVARAPSLECLIRN